MALAERNPLSTVSKGRVSRNYKDGSYLLALSRLAPNCGPCRPFPTRSLAKVLISLDSGAYAIFGLEGKDNNNQ